MKNRKTPRAFEDLMTSHYGALVERPSPSAMAEEIFASYYGRPVARRSGTPSVVLSLTFDDGETLVQGRKARGPVEYVPAGHAGATGCEEYVVEAVGLSRQTSLVSLATDVATGDEVAPFEEYLVDVLEPLKQTNLLPPHAATKIPANPADVGSIDPEAPRFRVEKPVNPAGTTVGGQGERNADPGLKAVGETSQAQADDDDFMADMKAIFAGRKVYDAARGMTVDRESLGRSPPAPEQRPAPSPPEVSSSQAIFDRIAQSMQFANAYDLGTVELSNRFSDFDRIAELQDRAAEQKRARKNEGAAAAPSTGTPADTADFLEDLEAIRARGLAPHRDGAVGYSRPFYDTGEHVLTAGDLYPDRLRLGKNPGVAFSYGQIVAMADLYESVDQMMDADPGELRTIKSLIERSTSYYEGHKAEPSLVVGDEMWDAATRERYLELAEENYPHFSPNLLFKSAQFARAVARHGNHRVAWEQHHRRAIEEAQRLSLAPESATSSPFPEWPLVINAFGDHFLADAFASGHVINKEEVIAYFKLNFFNGRSLKPEGKAFFTRVAALAFKGEVRKKFSVLETYDPMILWWNPNIDSEDAFRTLLVKAAEQQPDQIANLAVKALHDRLNKDGIEVFNDAGDGTWTLTGDGYLDARNLAIIKRAVQQSVANIEDPAIRASNLDFQSFFARVWKHVPRLTEASLKKVVQLGADYTRPDSELLRTAAAALITDKVSALIKKLKKEKKLKDA